MVLEEDTNTTSVCKGQARFLVRLIVRFSLCRPHVLLAEFYSVQPYQASSIHPRRHSPLTSTNDLPEPVEPPLPPLPMPRERGEHSKKARRLLSDLWLMSAATFRRAGKIEQAKGAIQEAEVQDEENPGVWVQVC